jgi:hypothetical protein
VEAVTFVLFLEESKIYQALNGKGHLLARRQNREGILGESLKMMVGPAQEQEQFLFWCQDWVQIPALPLTD